MKVPTKVTGDVKVPENTTPAGIPVPLLLMLKEPPAAKVHVSVVDVSTWLVSIWLEKHLSC